MPTGWDETGVARPRRRPEEREARLRRPCERFNASLRDAIAKAVVRGRRGREAWEENEWFDVISSRFGVSFLKASGEILFLEPEF